MWSISLTFFVKPRHCQRLSFEGADLALIRSNQGFFFGIKFQLTKNQVNTNKKEIIWEIAFKVFCV